MLDSAPRALALRLPNVASNGQDGRALLQTRTALWARFWSLLIAAFLVVGQLVGMLTIFVWVFAASLVTWAVLKATMGIRVSEEEEFEGVDLAECGMEAYPEFVKAGS